GRGGGEGRRTASGVHVLGGGAGRGPRQRGRRGVEASREVPLQLRAVEVRSRAGGPRGGGTDRDRGGVSASLVGPGAWTDRRDRPAAAGLRQRQTEDGR